MHSIYPEIILFEMLCNKERDVSMGNTLYLLTQKKKKNSWRATLSKPGILVVPWVHYWGTAFILLYGVIGAFLLLLGLFLPEESGFRLLSIRRKI